MKEKTKTQKTNEIVSLYPPSIREQSYNKFLKKVQRKNNGDNDTFIKFMDCLERVMQNYETFTINDVYYVCAAFEIPKSDVQELFIKWIDVMKEMGRINIVTGIEQPIYQPLMIM